MKQKIRAEYEAIGGSPDKPLKSNYFLNIMIIYCCSGAIDIPAWKLNTAAVDFSFLYNGIRKKIPTASSQTSFETMKPRIHRTHAPNREPKRKVTGCPFIVFDDDQSQGRFTSILEDVKYKACFIE
ncbi:hypothetical protein MLD38_013043 [Melastoma candidum]|uniref:Uncharacterized protein n=1 Tax=Melastoma candidum TaxID=119954 RepID=A0ACB9R9K4_9MYRT|nr:hypothetical protein MLD38_013043 [Melastoma candidum]